LIYENFAVYGRDLANYPMKGRKLAEHPSVLKSRLRLRGNVEYTYVTKCDLKRKNEANLEEIEAEVTVKVNG